MPRFVVLEHTKDDQAHFDLMLEQGDRLLTFSCPCFPCDGSECKCLFDHRLRYLDFEGDLGEGRGAVKRVEGGTFDFLSQDIDVLNVTLRGGRLKGMYELRQVDGDCWALKAVPWPQDYVI